MPTYSLSVPCPTASDRPVTDFGLIIALARERAHTLNRVSVIDMQGAGLEGVGCPNRWAVSPKGHLMVDGIQMPGCVGCGGT